jgi:hypothetical protein
MAILVMCAVKTLRLVCLFFVLILDRIYSLIRLGASCAMSSNLLRSVSSDLAFFA